MAKNNLELVEIVGRQAYTNSLIVAEGTNNEHRAILQLVRKYEPQLERWGKVEFRISNAEFEDRSNRGRPTQVAYLNEQQATFLITLLKNSEIVVAFKSELVDQFYKMREVINNWKNPEWQMLRDEVKITFRKLTDAIRDYIIPNARKLGSTTPDNRFYVSWAKMLCKIGCYKPGTRNRLSLTQLFVLDQMQDIAVAAIIKLTPEGLHYKEIFQLAKLRLDDYARIAMVADRFTSLAVVD